MGTRFGQLETTYGVRGGITYSLELWHDGLNKHRLIKGSDVDIVRRKSELQCAEWDDLWRRVSEREDERIGKELQKRAKEEKRTSALQRTAEAQSELDRLATILKYTLEINDVINWDRLKDSSGFPEARPPEAQIPEKPQPQTKPREPQRSDAVYQPKLSIFDMLVTSRKLRALRHCETRYLEDHKRWQSEVQAIYEQEAEADASYKSTVEKADQDFKSRVTEWERRRELFDNNQKASNQAIDNQRDAYMSGVPEAILEYCDMVLSSSKYPDYFPKEFDLDYVSEEKVLVVDYALPAPESIPTLKGVKYIAGTDSTEEQHLTQAQISKIYDELLYQIALRTIHEIFESDVINAIRMVVFNGIVTAIDRSSGKLVTACILSLQALRDEFVSINLGQVDPKTCFKALKGVGSSKLHGLAPVAPIMPLRREDGRFVSAYEVANSLDATVNLAAMDWEDFEHLIREVFEKEFSSNGGEVKVTRASRDGGVDAVAFDPDPIRGGKIVIQAKRYTATVGVGAVRDLYGTVLNEGANKGILVTTSDYGPDSYAFASGKPLVLLSGSNLLHMLEKHGHKARIDLQEARKLGMSQ